jgi:hypothetical protein
VKLSGHWTGTSIWLGQPAAMNTGDSMARGSGLVAPGLRDPASESTPANSD